MKKIILSFVIVLFVIIAQSCDGMISTEKEQKAIAEKILECLDEENTDELKSLFCEKILTEKKTLIGKLKGLWYSLRVRLSLMIPIEVFQIQMGVIMKVEK